MNRKNIEKKILEEILGYKESGMSGGDAFYSFRDAYFDKIQEEEEKTLVIDILLKLVRDRSRDPDFISRVAWICADLGISEAEEEIKMLSVDKRFQGTIYMNLIKSIVDQLEIENQLRTEIGRLKDVSDKRARMDIYDRAIASFRKLRGDTSRMYASKDVYEKSEADLSRTVVNNSLKKILRSARITEGVKEEVASILSDLKTQ